MLHGDKDQQAEKRDQGVDAAIADTESLVQKRLIDRVCEENHDNQHGCCCKAGDQRALAILVILFAKSFGHVETSPMYSTLCAGNCPKNLPGRRLARRAPRRYPEIHPGLSITTEVQGGRVRGRSALTL
ncbi:MAG: hypothetical protein AW06_003405 [Candidatus Accumulibacter cognatus]|uniref:Uncharacterized protein n=1 Tax=Candidatus Accumulibacter cognatus TaxID=2954383 RepID=A0A080M2J6_9PROT|nr:MAG: hypothetical protein AW06_003405 [Candidatus Accumulibacter cognatus]